MSSGVGSSGCLFEESDKLNDDQLGFFQRNGYLVVEHVLDDSDLQPLERGGIIIFHRETLSKTRKTIFWHDSM